MGIEVWDAEELAGLLMGLEDARRELIALTVARQEGDPTKHSDELVDAAKRWDELADQINEWPTSAMRSGEEIDAIRAA